MKITVDSIHIENFKRIAGQTVKLNRITALVGGNTSGKSSILQAAQLCTAINQAAFIENTGRTIKKHKTLALDEVLYRPTEKLLNLRFGEPASQTKNFILGFDCTITKAEEAPETLSLSIAVSRGKNANLSLNYVGDDKLIPILGDRDQPFSILTPGLSGIPLREEWKTRGALDAAAMHGDANLYLRTLLDHLLHQQLNADDVEKWCLGHYDIEDLPEGSSWRFFCEFLDQCYPGAFLYIHHDSNKDRYIDVTVEYNGHEFTLDSASTGMLQVIQILAYTCFYTPPLLLLDEPDAHLHADSQTRLHLALKALAVNTNTRIVLATHSPQLIQLMMNDEDVHVVWMNDGAEVSVPHGQRPAIPLLMELGALTLGAEAFDSAHKLIVLTEDKDAEFVRVLIAANYNKKFACLSYNGCANLAGARQLAILLGQLRPDAKIIIHRDRDFRTSPEMAFELDLSKRRFALEGSTNVWEIFTPMNDVEHSFLDIEHLCLTLAGRADEEQIRQALVDALVIKRDDIIAKIIAAREVIKRDLYDCDRMKKKVDIRAACNLPQQAPKTKSFLPTDGRQPLEVGQCHGKAAFRGFITELHKLIKGDSGDIERHIIKKTRFLRIPDWALAFKT